jgi:ethanolamine utilization microcompartment shell protein EutS
LILTNIFTGNIDGDRDGNGHLILNENANIKGEIGKNTSLDSITLNGQHMIYGGLRSKIINIANGAALIVKDKIDAKFIRFSDDKGLLTYNKSATLVPVSEQTNSKQILVKGQYEAADDVNSMIYLHDSTLWVNDDVKLYKSINVVNGKSGSIFFKGKSSIFNDIGFLNYYTNSNLAKSKITIFLQPKSKVTTGSEVNIYGDVILQDQSELTIKGDIHGDVWQFVLNKYGGCDCVDHGHLVLNPKSNIYGSVGKNDKKDARLVSITVNKANEPNIIRGDVCVNTINIESGGVLSIGGKIDAVSLVFHDDKGLFEYNVDSTLIPVNLLTNSRQILAKGQYLAASDVNSRIQIDNARLDVNNKVNLCKPVIINNLSNSIYLSFKGQSSIFGDITLSNKTLSSISLDSKSNVSTHDGVKIHGSVDLKDGSQLTISQGGYLLSADAAAGGCQGTVLAHAGSEIGNIGAARPIEKFSATNAKLFGAKYNAKSVVLSGANKLTNQNGVVINNLNTADNSIINAVGSCLTITGKDTKFSNKTTIALDMVEDALVFDNGINQDNFDGDINITFSSDATSVALLESTTIDKILNRAILLEKPVVRMNQVPSDVLKIVATEQNLFSIDCNNGNITVVASEHLPYIVSSLGPSVDGSKKIGPILAQMIVNESKSGASANQSYGNDTRLPVASQVISDTKTSPSISKQAHAPIDMLRVAQSVDSMIYGSLAIHMDLANLDHLSRPSALKFFISPIVGMLSLPLSADVVATTSQIGGVIFGAFYNLTNYQTNIGLALTIAGSYTKDTSKSKDAISGISALSAFIRKKFDNKLMLDVIATMQTMSGSLNQLLFHGDYKGSSQIRFISILPKIGYEISLNNEITFIPHIGAYINYCNRDAVTLKSSTLKENSRSLISGQQTKQQYLLLAGAKLASSGEYRPWHLQPFIDVNFYWNFKSSVDMGVTTLKGSEDNNLLQLSWNYCKDRPIWILGRLGLQIKTDNGFNAVLSVDANFAGNWSGNVAINYYF